MKVEDLGKLLVTVGIEGSSGVEQLDVTALLRIDEEQLDDELAKTPGVYGMFSVLAAKTDDRERRALAEFHLIEAQIDNEIRGTGEALKEGAITCRTRTDSRFQAAQKMWLDAKAASTTLQAIRASFEQKLSMMISISANIRQEKARANGQ